MTYAELTELIQQYLETSETTFVANIPQFIKNAEEAIYRSVQLPDLRKTSTSATADGVKYIEVPSDFLSAYSLAVVNDDDDYVFLSQKEQNYLQEIYPGSATEGLPRFFAIFNDEYLLLAPTPDQAYGIELNYFYKPASLIDGGASGTTWLSENAENALLFGSILEGYIYLKGDQDVVQQYSKKFEQSIGDLKIIYEGRSKKDTHRKSDMRMTT